MEILRGGNEVSVGCVGERVKVEAGSFLDSFGAFQAVPPVRQPLTEGGSLPAVADKELDDGKLSGASVCIGMAVRLSIVVVVGLRSEEGKGLGSDVRQRW